MNQYSGIYSFLTNVSDNGIEAGSTMDSEDDDGNLASREESEEESAVRKSPKKAKKKSLVRIQSNAAVTSHGSKAVEKSIEARADHTAAPRNVHFHLSYIILLVTVGRYFHLLNFLILRAPDITFACISWEDLSPYGI